MQYLYSDGELYHFMDVETFDQIAVDGDTVGDSLKFVKENEMVKVCSHEGNVFSVEPPISVELEVTETEPGVKGDTATGATKPAIVETGASVLVPLFVNQGDKIKIDTRTGEYSSCLLYTSSPSSSSRSDMDRLRLGWEILSNSAACRKCCRVATFWKYSS